MKFRPTKSLLRSIDRLLIKFPYLDHVEFKLDYDGFWAVVSSRFSDSRYYVFKSGVVLDRRLNRFRFH